MHRAFVGGAIAGVVFALHVQDRLPPGDSGELIVCALAAAPAHPPGYPVYVWLYHAVAVAAEALGLSLTWALNAFSALCGAVAFAALAALSSDAATAVAIAAVGMQSAALRALCSEAEVFALHLLCVSVLWLAYLKFIETRGLVYMVLWLVVSALALGNQHTSVLVALPMAVDVVVVRCLVAWRTVAVCALVGLLGCLVVYGSIWAMDRVDVYGWGGVDTGAGLVHHFLRSAYGTWKLHSGRNGMDRTSWWLTNVAYTKWLFEQLPVGLICSACELLCCMWDCFTCGRHPRGRWIACAVSWAVSSIGLNALINLPLSGSHEFVSLHVQVVGRLWLQSLLPILLLSGQFVERCCRSRVACRPAAQRVVMCVLVALVAASSGAGVLHSSVTSRQLAAVLDAYGSAALRSAPANAIVVTAGDLHLTAIRHAQRLRRERRDVLHIDRETSWYSWAHRRYNESGLLQWPVTDTGVNGLFLNLHDLAAANMHWRPVLALETPEMASEKPSVKDAFDVHFVGWLYQLSRKKPRSHRVKCPVLREQHGRCYGVPRAEGLVWFETLIAASETNTYWWSGVVELAKSMTPANSSVPVLLSTSVRSVAAAHPWQALALQQYHLSVKSWLLHVAGEIQTACADSDVALRSFQCVRQEAKFRLRAEYFLSDDVVTSAVRPFMRLLDQVIDQLTD